MKRNLVVVGWEKMNVCISHWNIYWFQWMSKIMFLRLCIDIPVGRFDIDIMVFLVFSSTLNWMLWKTNEWSQIDLLWHLKISLLLSQVELCMVLAIPTFFMLCLMNEVFSLEHLYSIISEKHSECLLSEQVKCLLLWRVFQTSLCVLVFLQGFSSKVFPS